MASNITIKSLLITMILMGVVLTAFIGALGDLSDTYGVGTVAGRTNASEVNSTAANLIDKSKSLKDDISPEDRGGMFEDIGLGGVTAIVGSMWGAITNLFALPGFISGAVDLIADQFGMDKWVVDAVMAIIGVVIVWVILRIALGSTRTGG